jgi:predicted porin
MTLRFYKYLACITGFIFLSISFSSSAFSANIGNKYDILTKKSYFDNSDFLTKEDFLTNKDLPQLQGVKFGNVTGHAILNMDFIGDSNIYLDTQGEEEPDTILLTNPKLGLVLPVQDFTFGIGYDVEIHKYKNFPDEDHTDDYIAGLAEYQLTDYTITLRDVVSDFSYRSGTDAPFRIYEDTNEFRADIGANFDQLGFTVGYTNFIQDYGNDEFIPGALITYDEKDNTVDKGDIQLRYLFMPKTSVLFEYGLGTVGFDSDKVPDADFYEVLVGLKGDLRHNLDVYLKGGYKEQTYDETSPFVRTSDFGGFVYRGGIEYLLTEDDIFNLNLEGNIDQSTYEDFSYFEADFVTLAYTHIFDRKLSGSIFSSYQQNEYPDEQVIGDITETRNDEYWGIGISLRYYIKEWLSTYAEYSYKERDSNILTYDYEVDRVTLRVSAGF